jgi:hypothetical protein
MAHDDAKSDQPDSRECATCYAQMTLVGKLPAVDDRIAAKVFRCYGCNSIETAPC